MPIECPPVSWVRLNTLEEATASDIFPPLGLWLGPIQFLGVTPSFPFFTSEWLTFTKSRNIIMFLYFFYASNETKTKQIGLVLMEIYTGSQESADFHISVKT